MIKPGNRKNSGSGKVITVNVYDLHENNDTLYSWGLGFYHSGVQVDNEEFTFSSGGVFSHSPKNVPDVKFRESIKMGTFQGTSADFDRIISSLRESFPGSEYNVLTRNCNSFAEELVRRLLHKEIPLYINRMANIGSYFSCLFPQNQLNNAPVNEQQVPLNQKSVAKSDNYRPASKVSTFAGSSGKKLGST